MKENLPLWKLALNASPDSFGLIPVDFSPSFISSSNTSASDDNSLEDIMPPDWEKYNYTAGNFDSTLLSAYDKLKQLFPGVYVNVNNGKRVNSWCGLRSPACDIGAAQSAHKTGKALDLHHGSKLKELRDFCESTEGLELGIKRVEHRDSTRTWVHIDVMPPNASNWKDKTKPYIFVP
ncbi:MAG: hypothetical protein LBC87_08190 [Fibromonadaceae bacterium]|jgi:uncharacterized protein YcbK (DUF882 family)|nr:hypothetical protein [Fibromonadaceae bacterium]